MTEAPTLFSAPRAPFASSNPFQAIVGAGDGLIATLVDGELRVYDVASGVLIACGRDNPYWPSEPVLFAAVDETCTMLAQATRGGVVTLEDIPRHNVQLKVEVDGKSVVDRDVAALSQLSAVHALALSPDGNLVAAATRAGVRVYGENELDTLAGTAPLVFSPDSNLLLAGTELYDVDLGLAAGSLAGLTEAAAFSVDSSHLARVVLREDGRREVEVMRLADSRIVRVFALEHRVEAVGFSAGGDRLACAGSGRFIVWKVADNVVLEAGAFEAWGCVVLSEPFVLFGIDHFARHLLKRDLSIHAEQAPALGHRGPVCGLVKIGDKLVSASEDGVVLVWELGTGRTGAELPPPRRLNAPSSITRIGVVCGESTVLVAVGGATDNVVGCAWTWPELTPIQGDCPSLPVDRSSNGRRVVLPTRALTLEMRTTDYEATGVHVVGADHRERKLQYCEALLAVSADERWVATSQGNGVDVLELDRYERVVSVRLEEDRSRVRPSAAFVEKGFLAIGTASGDVYWGYFDPAPEGPTLLLAPERQLPVQPYAERRRRALSTR
ncbi:MAG: WD40 repeat domain-containing protein [Polyangiaceae bacterium]